jgi:hypothetical protein
MYLLVISFLLPFLYYLFIFTVTIAFLNLVIYQYEAGINEELMPMRLAYYFKMTC